MVDVDGNAWDRQPGESKEAFHAFCHYRDLGLKRSVDKAWRLHRGMCAQRPVPPTKRAAAFWEAWASKYQWTARVSAYDADLDRKLQEDHRKAMQAVRDRHANLAAGALTALSAPVKMVLEALRDPEKLKALQERVATDPEAFAKLLNLVARTASAIPGLVNVERLSLGLSTESIEVEDKRDDASDIARRIREDPDATQLAIGLLRRVAGTDSGEGASQRSGAHREPDDVEDGPAS